MTTQGDKGEQCKLKSQVEFIRKLEKAIEYRFTP